MSAAAPPAEILHGVSLEQYAGVTAALLEGFPLADILANEQIAPGVWPPADAAWKARVATDGAEGPVFAAFRDKRAMAEDCLARAVAPIDSDLGAWMSFLHAFGAHPAPGELLSGAGLGVNDLSRLQRRWARRMAEDANLPKQAAELAKKGPGPLPSLHVDPPALRPFPWSLGRAPEPVKVVPRVAAPSDTSMAPGKLRLFSYVALKARLAESAGSEQSVLEQLGVKDFATTDAGWQAVLRDDPELERDYRRLLGVQRAKIRAAAKQGPAAPPAPEIQSPPPAPAAPVPEAPPRRPPSKLAGTALAVDVLNKKALPFAEGAPAAAPAPLAEAPKPAPRRDLGGTAMALDLPSRAALPFPAPPAPPAPSRIETASSIQPAPVMPPGEGAPRLTLEQHASLACEIAEAPERALEALARYRVTPAEKQDADRHYADLFARSPGARTAWDAVFNTYRTWLLANRANRAGR